MPSLRRVLDTVRESQGFAEVKILLLRELLEALRRIHDDGARRHLADKQRVARPVKGCWLPWGGVQKPT